MLILEGDRTSLFARADARLDAMMEAGFADEVASLLSSGFGPDLPSMSALGYRELARYLTDELTLGAALEATRASTRAFIRRQTTWFRREEACHRISTDDPNSEGIALKLIESWLRSATL
jgi:tRNA dimethylallyltransferase